MNKRIVVVDDNSTIRAVTAFVLSGFGYTVLEADGGNTGLALIQREQPDLVVTDVSMPGMTGLEMTQALTADPKTANIPVIMVTANKHPGDVEAGYKCGARAYVFKPFRPSELLGKVAQLLSEQKVTGKVDESNAI